jgi:hypothetical protein
MVFAIVPLYLIECCLLSAEMRCVLFAGDVADVVLGFSELKPYLVRRDLR